jgi:hypothetical protein
VRALCRQAGLGGVATRAEEALWVARAAGDCEPLRAYLADFPGGACAEEAQKRLQAAGASREETWNPAQRRLPMTVRQSLDPLATESAARADALTRGAEEARLVCAGFNAGEFRLVSSSAGARSWRCAARGGGAVCGFDGEAVCEVEQRVLSEREVCP